MTAKGTLSFMLNLPDVARRARIPVEVWDAKLKLHGSGLSDQSLTVEPGSYFIGTRLPDGSDEILAEVKVAPGSNETVSLTLPTHAARELAQKLAPPVMSAAVMVAEAVPGAEGITAQEWRGNWLLLWLEEPVSAQEPLSVAVTPGAAAEAWRELAPPPPGAGDLLLVANEGREATGTFFAIPFDGPVHDPQRQPTRVRLQQDPDRLPEIELAFVDPDLATMLRYVEQGLAREAQTYSRAMIEVAESAMLEKEGSPLGAVLASYVLLRANLVEGCDRGTENLLRLAPWLPDVLALRVEYLARRGRHQEAVRELVRAREFGCPWFRSGVVFLFDRARLYLATAGVEDLILRPQQRSELGLLVSGLGRLLTFLDPDRTVATYRGVPIAP